MHAQNQTRVFVHFLFARQSHQAPRSITVPVLLLVGIVRVSYTGVEGTTPCVEVVIL
jgi:hypothetical protein